MDLCCDEAAAFKVFFPLLFIRNNTNGCSIWQTKLEERIDHSDSDENPTTGTTRKKGTDSTQRTDSRQLERGRQQDAQSRANSGQTTHDRQEGIHRHRLASTDRRAAAIQGIGRGAGVAPVDDDASSRCRRRLLGRDGVHEQPPTLCCGGRSIGHQLVARYGQDQHANGHHLESSN